MDKTFASFDTLNLLTSLLLNPLVFCFYRLNEQKQTRNIRFQLAGRLYQYLALSDFLTSIVYMPPVIVNVASPTLQYYVHFKDFNSSYYEYQSATYGLRTVSFFGDRLMFLSAIFTTLLVVTRFIKIVRPFCHIRLSYIHIYVMLTVLVSTGRMLYLYINNKIVWSGCSQLFQDENISLIEDNATFWNVFGMYKSVIAAELIANLPFYLHCLSSCIFILATLVTLFKLRKHPGSKDKLLGMKPILLLNCGVCLHGLLIAIHAANFTTMSLNMSCLFSFLTRSVLPSFLSSYNPIVLFICNKDIRILAKKLIRLMKSRSIAKTRAFVLYFLVQFRKAEENQKSNANNMSNGLTVPHTSPGSSLVTENILLSEISRNEADVEEI